MAIDRTPNRIRGRDTRGYDYVELCRQPTALIWLFANVVN